MKKFLGIICLLYSGIVLYVWAFDKIKLFLAPQMSVYLKLSSIPLLLIGLVLCLNSKFKYKFKITDLVLLLPLVMLICAGNGNLTGDFAKNRITNYNNIAKANIKRESKKKNANTIERKKENESTKKDNITKNDVAGEYDFSSPYFDIIDANYNDLSNYITYYYNRVSKFVGKTIRVKGMAIKDLQMYSDDYFMIGKLSISCCAADASYSGFIVKYDQSKIKKGGWYQVEGVLEQGTNISGEETIIIKAINIKEISSKGEEQYVYPCYSYDEGNCEAVKKYDLGY